MKQSLLLNHRKRAKVPYMQFESSSFDYSIHHVDKLRRKQRSPRPCKRLKPLQQQIIRSNHRKTSNEQTKQQTFIFFLLLLLKQYNTNLRNVFDLFTSYFIIYVCSCAIIVSLSFFFYCYSYSSRVFFSRLFVCFYSIAVCMSIISHFENHKSH